MVVSFWFASALIGLSQQCPQHIASNPDTASAAETLKGKLIYHDGIRQWFELKLDTNACDQTAIQLIAEGAIALDRFRGCQVEATGPLDYSGTGYFSLDIYQAVTRIAPVGECPKPKPLTDYSSAKPAKQISRYTVVMRLNYRAGDHPILFSITANGRRLFPWQAYASYQLTGSFALYGQCGEGFSVASVFGTPEAQPLLIETATFDPESAAAVGKRDLRLGYICVRTK